MVGPTVRGWKPEDELLLTQTLGLLRKCYYSHIVKLESRGVITDSMISEWTADSGTLYADDAVPREVMLETPRPVMHIQGTACLDSWLE